MNDTLLPSQLLAIGFKYSANTHPYMDLYTLPGVGGVYFFPKRKFFAAYKSKVRILINTLQDIKNQINIKTMKTGIELIAQERQEQIEKHGYSVEMDQHYQRKELIQASLFCLNPEVFTWPVGWNEQFKQKLLSKEKRIDILAVAGAFIAAEIDRINAGAPYIHANDPASFWEINSK